MLHQWYYMWKLSWMVSVHSWISLWDCGFIVGHLAVWKADQIDRTFFTEQKSGFIHSYKWKCFDVVSWPALSILKHRHSAWTWLIQILYRSDFTVWSKVSNGSPAIALTTPKHKFSLEHSWEGSHAAIFDSSSFVPSLTKILFLPFSIACRLSSTTTIGSTFGAIFNGGFIIMDNGFVDIWIDCSCFGTIFLNKFLIDFAIRTPCTISSSNLDISLKNRKRTDHF